MIFSNQITWLLALVLLVLSLSEFVLSSTRASQVDDNQHGLGHSKLPRILNYEFFLGKYHHRSSSGQGTLGYMRRMSLFIARTLAIFKHNALYASKAVGHYLQQNMFTDITVRESVHFFASNNSGLEPVLGASSNPNMSAEKYMSILMKSNPRRSNQDADDEIGVLSDQDDYDDGHSFADMSSFEDDSKDSTETIRRQQSVGLDFLHVPRLKETTNSLDELKGLFQDNKIDSKLAKRITHLMTANSKTIESKVIKQRLDKIEQARRLNGIVQVPFVPANNRNYDPSLLPSHGLVDFVSGYLSGGAFGLDDKAWDYDGEYEEVNEGEQANSESLLSTLIGKLIANYDMFDEEFEDALDDKEEEHNDDRDIFEDARDSFEDEKSNQPSKPGEIVYDIDWRQTGCISRPKNQLDCNSCYAFATLDLMEFSHCRQKKTYTEFSVQYVIDCGSKTQLNGCRGGKLSHVGLFIKTHGIQLNSMYPYLAREQQCPFDEANDREQRSYSILPTITGWRLFNEISAWYKWLPKTPMIVGINMPSDFLAYGGGVHDGADCTENMVHALTLVGSGKQDGKPFWLLKNSFSSDWGEGGYFRLSKRAPLKCFNSAIVARANFNV